MSVSVRQRSQYQSVHHAEDRRVRANAQRQRDHGNCRESGMLQQASDTVTNVLEEILHGATSSINLPAPSPFWERVGERVLTIQGAQLSPHPRPFSHEEKGDIKIRNPQFEPFTRNAAPPADRLLSPGAPGCSRRRTQRQTSSR